MLMELVLPCLLVLVVEIWGHPTPPAHPPPVYQPPSQHGQPQQYHQPGYAPAGYATPAPATGYGASGGYGTDLMSDPATMMLLMQQDDELDDDNLMLMASMMGNKYGGFGGGMNPMMLMHLMENGGGGLSSNPLAMMAMMGGGKKMNPFLMSKLLQCKEKHDKCIQPNKKGFMCGIGVDNRYPCCTCPNTKEATYPMDWNNCLSNPCPDNDNPMCGADGKTYRNRRCRKCAGVSLDHEGTC